MNTTERRMDERMKQLLRQYAAYLRSDEAVTDDFLGEGVTFEEAMTMMDHTAQAVDEYVAKLDKK